MPPLRTLTQDQVDTFFRDGFLFIRNFFSAEDVAAMSAGFDELELAARDFTGVTMHKGTQFVLRDPLPGESTTAGAAGRPRIRRVVWCGGAAPVLDRYGEDPRLLRIAADILGSDSMEHLINQAHFKLPHDGIYFPWHQDSTHRGYGTAAWQDVNGRGSFVQIATAIDPATTENGPLKFIPGSCRNGHLGLLYGEDKDTPLDKFDPSTAVDGIMAPGDIALFGPYTIHGSEANNSDLPRRVFINGFAYPGANSRKYPGHEVGAGRRISCS